MTRWKASLDQLDGDPQGLRAICQALKSEVYYEMNEMGVAQSLLADALTSIEQTDAWLDVLAATYRVRARLAFVQAGLPGALSELAHADAAARDRQMPRLARLMAVERIRALTLSDEIKTANIEMQRIGLDPGKLDANQPQMDWGLRHGTTNVAIARWLVRARRAKRALDFVDLAEETAIRGGQLLSLAKLRVIRAQAHLQLNARSDATSALLSSIRLLGKQPFRRFILDEGLSLQPVVQAALDGDQVKVPINTAQRRQLSEIMHHWSSGGISRPRGNHATDKADSTGGIWSYWRRVIPTRKLVASWGFPPTRSNIISSKFTANCTFTIGRVRSIRRECWVSLMTNYPIG